MSGEEFVRGYTGGGSRPEPPPDPPLGGREEGRGRKGFALDEHPFLLGMIEPFAIPWTRRRFASAIERLGIRWEEEPLEEYVSAAWSGVATSSAAILLGTILPADHYDSPAPLLLGVAALFASNLLSWYLLPDPESPKKR